MTSIARIARPRCFGFFVSLAVLFALACGTARAHETSMTGLVLATIPAKGEAIVRHGVLFATPAGIATFRVEPASALRQLRAGTTIEATADADATPWMLSAIRISGTEAVTGAVPPLAPAGSVLRNVRRVLVGDVVPAPPLLDERGRPFSLRALRGQEVVMAFIYTRCRDARECPLVTARFGALQQRFRGERVHLVEITLDPAYDRPAVLASYGRTYGEDPALWTFATGAPDTVLDFAAQFDVTAFPDERVGLIHPERLAIIDRSGVVRELVDEGAWTPEEVVATVHHDEGLASNPLQRLDLWLSSAAVSVCGNGVAGFSGFGDLLIVLAIFGSAAYLLWRVARSLTHGAT